MNTMIIGTASPALTRTLSPSVSPRPFAVALPVPAFGTSGVPAMWRERGTRTGVVAVIADHNSNAALSLVSAESADVYVGATAAAKDAKQAAPPRGEPR